MEPPKFNLEHLLIIKKMVIKMLGTAGCINCKFYLAKQ